MPSTHRVSVAMATFNGARFLPEQLDSILSQRIEDGWELEIVIADDHSTDETLSVLKAYSRSVPHLVVLPSRSNAGVVPTFERALRACTGDFVLLSDQDDKWPEDRVLSLVHQLRKGADLAYGDALITDVDLRPVELLKVGPPGSDLRFKNRIPGMTMGFRATLLDAVLPIDAYIHDWWILLIALQVGRVEYLPRVVTHYRQHGRNAIGTQPRRRRGAQYLDDLRERTRFYRGLSERLEGSGDAEALAIYRQLSSFYECLATGDLRHIMKAGTQDIIWSNSVPRRAWLATLRSSLTQSHVRTP